MLPVITPPPKYGAFEMAKFGVSHSFLFPFPIFIQEEGDSRGALLEPLPQVEVSCRKSGRSYAKHWEFRPHLPRSFLNSGAWFHLIGGCVSVCRRHAVCSAPSAQIRPVAGAHMKPQPDSPQPQPGTFIAWELVILLSDACGNSLLPFKVLIFFLFIDSFWHF